MSCLKPPFVFAIPFLELILNLMLVQHHSYVPPFVFAIPFLELILNLMLVQHHSYVKLGHRNLCLPISDKHITLQI